MKDKYLTLISFFFFQQPSAPFQRNCLVWRSQYLHTQHCSLKGKMQIHLTIQYICRQAFTVKNVYPCKCIHLSRWRKVLFRGRGSSYEAPFYYILPIFYYQEQVNRYLYIYIIHLDIRKYYFWISDNRFLISENHFLIKKNDVLIIENAFLDIIKRVL